MTLESLAEKTVRLIKFMGVTNKCVVTVTEGGTWENSYYCITWSKDCHDDGETQTVCFFVYERMKNKKEVDQILVTVQRRMDIMFGEE